MKKLIALLLALLLPAAALADATALTVKLTVNEEAYADMLAKELVALLGEEAEGTGGMLATAVAGLLNGFTLDARWQGDAAEITLSADGVEPVSFAFWQAADVLTTTSNLLPGYGLTAPVEALQEDPLTTLLGSTDWSVLLAEVMTAAGDSLSGIDVTTARGSFSGNAYSSGTYCTTITLDDSDIAALLQSLLTPSLRELLTEALSICGLDAPTIIAELDAMHQDVASANAYQYVIRLVSDAENVPVGASALVLSCERQLASVSIGFAEKAFQLVIGVGLGETNHWAVHSINYVAQNDGFTASGECVEFTGAKDDSFTYAAATMKSVLADSSWSLKMSAAGDGLACTYDQTDTVYKAAQTVEQDTTSGFSVNALIREKTCSVSMKWTQNGVSLRQLNAECLPAADMAHPSAELILCDLDSQDEEQLSLQSELSAMIGAGIIQRLMSLFPLELLLNTP